jgi:hypothetical protein
MIPSLNCGDYYRTAKTRDTDLLFRSVLAQLKAEPTLFADLPLVKTVLSSALLSQSCNSSANLPI